MELFQIMEEGERERIRYGGNPYRALFRFKEEGGSAFTGQPERGRNPQGDLNGIIRPVSVS